MYPLFKKLSRCRMAQAKSIIWGVGGATCAMDQKGDGRQARVRRRRVSEYVTGLIMAAV